MVDCFLIGLKNNGEFQDGKLGKVIFVITAANEGFRVGMRLPG
jgi:hypothetical protein